MKVEHLTDEQINQLISEVESEYATLLKSETAAKSALVKDDEGLEEQADENAEAIQQDAQPELEAAPEAEQAPAQEADAQVPAEEAAPEMGEQGQEEPQAEESLENLYAQLPDEELEAHYNAIRAVMEQKWQSEAEQAPEAQPEMEQAPEQEAQPEIAKEEKESEEEKKEEAKEEEAEEKKEDKEEEVKKTERETELEESLSILLKAFETRLPERKAVTAVIQKSEAAKPLQKSENEVYADVKRVSNMKLHKSDRDILTDYFLERTNGTIGEQTDKSVRKLISEKLK